MSKKTSEAVDESNNAAAELDGDETQKLDTAIPSDWGDEEIQTNFPPYWPGDVKSTFLANVVGYDDSDPEFERYALRALRDTKCARGGKRNQIEVIVKKGEIFTCSAWTALRLKDLVGLDVFVEALPNMDANTPAGFVRSFRVVPSKAAMKELKERSKAIVVKREERRVLQGQLQD